MRNRFHQNAIHAKDWSQSTYADELMASGVKPVRTKEDGERAFGECGLAIIVYRPGLSADRQIEVMGMGLAGKSHPDIAVVYADETTGEYRYVDLRRSAHSGRRYQNNPTDIAGGESDCDGCDEECPCLCDCPGCEGCGACVCCCEC